MKYLLTIGFKGFRMDMAEHVPETLFEGIPKDTFIVGEVWTTMNYGHDGRLAYDQDNHRQRIMNYVDRHDGICSAFDFTTKGILQEALTKNEYYRLKDNMNRPAGVNGWWGEKAVTFIDNHDTGGQNQWVFSHDMNTILRGYAYIMSHPGLPCVYIDHMNDAIIDMIQIRQRCLGELQESELMIQDAGDIYQSVYGNLACSINHDSYKLWVV